ncbi:MAG: class I adenylate cyclase, partial [Pseudomonadota bacterium]
MNYVYSDPNPIPLDRHHLHNVRRAFLHLNNARLELAKESLGEAQRLFLDILPALIHFNHPMLPGYVTRSTPSGVYGFSMANEEQMNQLRKLTRSFNPSTYRDNKQEQTDILALYSMGSMGTIAQNSKSDIDIWLCYRPNLSYREQELLSEKCKRICAWAKNLDIDATIFLMDHLNFCAQTQLSFSKEASGSTQHYLLLDEFYRTIIHLAGQLPIWLFVRPEQEHSYEAIAKAIQEQRLLPENQDVDFGNIDSIPASEFISSAIWQLYKAIESPYKSILKLLVLEIYCHQYPDLPLLSNHFKSHLHDVDKNKMVNLWDVDPYLLNYYFIEEYLLSTKQTPRLEFIRRCFYFKLDQPLTDNDKQSRKLSIIGEMARSWGWDNDFISHLDNHRSWSLKDTLDERRRIINELNNSYQQIMNFFRNQKGQIQVPNREMNILGRKLHAAFAKKTGKIDWVNPVISNNITEPEITIRKQANSDLWAAVDCNDKAIASKATPLELITWLHCNQVMIAATRLLFNNQQTDTRLYYSLRRFITSLIPLPLTIAKHNDFEKGCQLKKLLFFVDYRPDKFQLTDTITDRVNLLSLTCDIDVLTINSWNEIICTHKQGPLLESMIAIFIGIFKRETNHFNPDILFNYPERNIQQTIRSFFAPLFKRVIEFFKQCPRGRYITHINNRYLLIHLGDQGSDIQWLSTERELKKILLSPMPYYSPVYMDMETMAYHPLAIF